MEQILIEACEKIIKALEILKAEGKITSEQYEKHTKLKMSYLKTQTKSKNNRTII